MDWALIGYGKMGKLLSSSLRRTGFAVGGPAASADNRDGAGITAAPFRGDRRGDRFLRRPPRFRRTPSGSRRWAFPWVVGTTGWTERLPEVRKAVERSDGGFLHGANFSVGVMVFYRLAEAAARLLAQETAYEAWGPRDPPQQEEGRALRHDAPAQEGDGGGGIRPDDRHRQQSGGIDPRHPPDRFDSEADTITLEHRARSRAGFAHGALRAAPLDDRPAGIFEFSEVWEEIVRQET